MMIDIDHVSFQYSGAERENLQDFNLQIEKGECVVLTGESGCGKTCVTRLINTLIPHFYEGEMFGTVLIDGVDTRTIQPHDLSDKIGSVFQNPRSQFFSLDTDKERSYYRYEDGKRVKHTVTPVLGEKAAHNGKVVYSLDFEVTPHQLRHTYITNLIHASVDPKTVQYLAGHESSKITMDIYAKVKYNRPDELVRSMSCAFASWDAAQ